MTVKKTLHIIHLFYLYPVFYIEILVLTKIYQAFDISATLVKCFSAVGAKIYNAITFICLNLMLKNFSIASKYCIFQTINKPEILKKKILKKTSAQYQVILIPGNQ